MTHGEEWKLREKELEEMGFKGGQGRSNHEIYDCAGMCAFGCGFLLLIGCVMLIGILAAKIFNGV